MSMIVAKCPLRISLVGGSTDLDAFIEEFGTGSVISFPSNLYAYIAIHENNRGKYIVNYSQKEEVSNVSDIKNDIARVVLEHFMVSERVTLSFNTDVFTEGSGLAASSAYMVAAVKAVSMFKGQHLSEFEVCRIALSLERYFNPLTGYQDPYGCGVGGFKRMDFPKNKRPMFRYFDSSFLTENCNMFLLYTDKSRNSTNVLKGINIHNAKELIPQVNSLENTIETDDFEAFTKVITKGWNIKKRTSKLILQNGKLHEQDQYLSVLKNNGNILSYKLLGAGGGGYFLLLCSKDVHELDISAGDLTFAKLFPGTKVVPVHVNETGVVGTEI